MTERRPDPNQQNIDPMVPEYWQLGEDVQDAIRNAGFESEEVEGIAVDIHDLLQASDKIRDELAPKLAAGNVTSEDLQALAGEFDHILWHCESAKEYIASAKASLKANS